MHTLKKCYIDQILKLHKKRVKYKEENFWVTSQLFVTSNFSLYINSSIFQTPTGHLRFYKDQYNQILFPFLSIRVHNVVSLFFFFSSANNLMTLTNDSP